MSRGRYWLLQFLLGGAFVFAAAAQLPAQTPNSVSRTDETGGSITVRSDIQEANSETGIITARGNVQISYPERQLEATAAQVQFYQNERRLVLSGNVYVLQDGNSIRAEVITYLIDEGRIIASPEDLSQVESTYIVTEEQAIAPADGANAGKVDTGDTNTATSDDSPPRVPNPTVPSLESIQDPTAN
nr:LptA/OstA family protein [Rubidibacter lacunae]